MQQHPVVESRPDLRTVIFEKSVAYRNALPLGPRPNIDHKWRLVSGLQNAIRRNDPEVAVRCADALLELDPAYLWRRLKVIALEDVGFGNLLACGVTFEASKARDFRRKIGERTVLAVVVSELADSVKDRSLCDLHLLNRCMAPTKGWAEYVNKQDVPWLLEFLAVHRRTADQLGTQIPRLHRKFPDDPQIVMPEPDPYGDIVIDGLPAASYDMYCHEGKRASSWRLAESDPRQPNARWNSRTSEQDRSETIDRLHASFGGDFDGVKETQTPTARSLSDPNNAGTALLDRRVLY